MNRWEIRRRDVLKAGAAAGHFRDFRGLTLSSLLARATRLIH